MLVSLWRVVLVGDRGGCSEKVNVAVKVHKDDYFIFRALVLSMYVLLGT